MSKAKAETFIGDSQPDHNHQWDAQCARCGSTLDWQECESCGGHGVDGHDCGEDCCCCLDPDDNIPCDICGGRGGWWQCFSSREWCEANPLKGREQVDRATPEWYRAD